jgi:branched-subunit amino acid aminotransferase/4-amino-4-deoxychorismate lyase
LPPLRLQTRRYARDLPAVKHAGLFGAIHHRREAQRQGYDDVLFTTDSSHLTEGATWNIGFLTSEQIIWPNGSCLPGVTMRLVQGALPALGMESGTRPVHRDELGRMEAAFITNAGVGVRSVASIDSVAYAPDVQAIDRLQERYLAIPGDPL